jgi:prepilin-type N-terminal cleavage/methylation domain-containing protein
MRTSSAGRTTEAGVTLVEMMIVVAIVGMIAGITYPAVASGLEAVHLSSSAEDAASFINAELNRVERRQEVIELVISVKEGSLAIHSTEPGFERKLGLPEGITIVDADPNATHQLILMPGGTAPRIGIELKNRKGRRRIVRVDPMTGIPRIEIPAATP